MTKLKTYTNQPPAQMSNTSVDAQAEHQRHQWKRLKATEKGKSRGCSPRSSACSATAALLLPALARGFIHHFSLTSINSCPAEIKHSLQVTADHSAL